jgi:mRNA interferase YafQ
MNRLKEVMLLLIANDNLLGLEWLDHPIPSRAGESLL